MCRFAGMGNKEKLCKSVAIAARIAKKMESPSETGRYAEDEGIWGPMAMHMLSSTLGWSLCHSRPRDCNTAASEAVRYQCKPAREKSGEWG